MLARCSHCRSTFFAERFGVQHCPACGVEVFVADPKGAQPERKAPAQEERGVQPPPAASSPEADEASVPSSGDSPEPDSSGSGSPHPTAKEARALDSAVTDPPTLDSPAPESPVHEGAEFETPQADAPEAAESPEVSQPSASARDPESESANFPAPPKASGFAGAVASSGSGGSKNSNGEAEESDNRTEGVEDSDFSKPSEGSLPFFEDRKAEDAESSVESGEDAQLEQSVPASGVVERLEGAVEEREGAPGSQSSEEPAQTPPPPAHDSHEQQHWPAPVPAWYTQGQAREAQPKAQLTPWENPESSGFFRPVFETLSGVLGRPQEFFSQLDWRSAHSAHTWFMLVAVFPSVISAFISQSLRDPAASAKAMEEAIAGLPEENREIARRVAEYFNTASEFSSLGTLLLVPLGYFAFLYISAGISHLVLMALGENRSGWTGTFKAFVYGCTPMAFALLPICGGFIAQIWTLALCVFAVSRAHKSSTGHALVAVVLVPALAFCCLSFAGVMSLVMSMGQGG